VKASAINDWLGVITNLGVIGGLALVAYEIHQNSIALESEARSSDIDFAGVHSREITLGISTSCVTNCRGLHRSSCGSRARRTRDRICNALRSTIKSAASQLFDRAGAGLYE